MSVEKSTHFCIVCTHMRSICAGAYPVSRWAMSECHRLHTIHYIQERLT